MAALEVGSPEEAERLFRRALAGEFKNFDFDGIEIGDWANPHITVFDGNSEITAPYMQAFLDAQAELYQLVALVKYDVADARKLSDADIERFRIRVKVTQGSSNFMEGLGEVLARLAEESVGKLSANQIMILLVGGAFLFSGMMGWKAHVEARKEIRIEEVKNETQQKQLETMQFMSKQQADVAKFMAEQMAKQGGAVARTAEAAEASNASLLRAAALAGPASIDGTHITREEAELLRNNRRRRADVEIVEQMAQVTDINTSDPASTTVTIEGIGDEPLKVTFADRLIQERDLNKLYRSLRERREVRIKLDVTRLGDTIRSAKILRVVTPRAS